MKKLKLEKPNKATLHLPVKAKRKSPIKVEQSRPMKGAAGSAELKAQQKMFGITKPPRAKKMLKAEQKAKKMAKYSPHSLM